jgi:hypothetical protein
MDAITNPLELLRSLDADALHTRLAALQAEADALRVLLRSARARERRQGGDRTAATSGRLGEGHAHA